MKKGFKLVGIISLVSMFTLSVSGCSVSQKKINKNSEAVKDTSLYFAGEQEADFKLEYRYTYTKGDTNDTFVATISKDVDTQTYYLTYNSEAKNENLKVYLENGSAYVEGKDSNGVTTKTRTDYASPKYYFDSTDYKKLSYDIYEVYKYVPYLGCNSLDLDEFENMSEREKDEAKREIRQGLPEINKLSMQFLKCKASKRLFGKDITYKIHYALNDLSSFRDIELKVNKDNKISYIKITNSISVGSDYDYSLVKEINISYDDVK